MNRKIFCCKCQKKVRARLTSGKIIYPHRQDLYELKIWQCPSCNNYVGCHKGTINNLGSIPTPEIKRYRTIIHGVIDPLWINKIITRKELYKTISLIIDKDFHIGKINTTVEAKRIYNLTLKLREQILNR